MKTRTALFVATFCMVFLGGVAWSGTRSEGAKAGRFASERNANTFAGATRIVIEGFDVTDKDVKSAKLQLDKNGVTFSPFGDPEISTVFYKPFQVELTRLKIPDPSGKDRRVYSVGLPKEQGEGLGKNSLRLVVPAGAKSEMPSLRLLLISPEGKILQSLDLRPVSN